MGRVNVPGVGASATGRGGHRSLFRAHSVAGRAQAPLPVEVLFERICRENGITARLTKRRSPTTTGKVERFHRTLRRELLDETGAFASIEAAQAGIDDWVHAYNTVRPTNRGTWPPQPAGYATGGHRTGPKPTDTGRPDEPTGSIPLIEPPGVRSTPQPIEMDPRAAVGRCRQRGLAAALGRHELRRTDSDTVDSPDQHPHSARRGSHQDRPVPGDHRWPRTPVVARSPNRGARPRMPRAYRCQREQTSDIDRIDRTPTATASSLSVVRNWRWVASLMS